MKDLNFKLIINLSVESLYLKINLLINKFITYFNNLKNLQYHQNENFLLVPLQEKTEFLHCLIKDALIEASRVLKAEILCSP